ncbi:YihY/virulence factor BrkB family protein [Nocardioides sp. J2M5]|uniref:YhjD/YihY/BrkB family envelope integrity protein n=1 Tax=Nocardioides palaemonis TaxID=2829810 RepID=UPI001BA94FA7|nr:YhjD/YihY/BrkB family envelope integrity protein [Nocardioides palaemonis]MBS2940066.1 YihY/virulence factor BrkB family protein [Nocardioides palaemonis]
MSAPGPRVLVDHARELEHRFEHTVPVRLVRVFLAVDGRDRVLMLAGQAFIAVIPLLIVVATVSGTGGAGAVGGYLVDRFDLDGSAEASVRILFDRPPDATGGITILSVVVLLWTTNSFARSLQRTFAAAWSLPRTGIRGTGQRTVGLGVLLVVLFGLSFLGGRLEEGPLVTPVVVVVQVVVLVGGWALAAHLMLGRRVPLRRLLPGAVASAVVQVLVGWGTAIWLPGLVTRNADNYGVIGAALALVSWLIVVSASIVASAVLGRVLDPETEATRA